MANHGALLSTNKVPATDGLRENSFWPQATEGWTGNAVAMGIDVNWVTWVKGKVVVNWEGDPQMARLKTLVTIDVSQKTGSERTKEDLLPSGWLYFQACP